MNGYQMALFGAALSASLAGCDDAPAPADEKPRVARIDTNFTTLTLGSGTGSAQGLRPAADFIPDDATVDFGHPRGGSALGVGLRPGGSASGISP